MGSPARDIKQDVSGHVEAARIGDIVMKTKETIEGLQTLKPFHYFGLALMVAGIVCSSVFALDPLGPPACGLYKGEYEGGIDVSWSRQDLETTQGKWTQTTAGIVTDWGAVDLGTLKGFETSRACATLAYCPIHNWEAFVRLGGTTGVLGDEFWSDKEEFESQRELAIGCGIRTTFFEEIALKIGGLVQASLSEFDGKLDASHWPAPDCLEISMFEIQAALGATYLFSDRLSIYGGPFAYQICGDLDYVYTQADNNNLVTWRLKWDLEEDINYGGYFGARIMLKQDCSFNIEYQQTDDAQVIGASLMLRR